jgi:hypothetical protein
MTVDVVGAFSIRPPTALGPVSTACSNVRSMKDTTRCLPNGLSLQHATVRSTCYRNRRDTFNDANPKEARLSRRCDWPSQRPDVTFLELRLPQVMIISNATPSGLSLLVSSLQIAYKFAATNSKSERLLVASPIRRCNINLLRPSEASPRLRSR